LPTDSDITFKATFEARPTDFLDLIRAAQTKNNKPEGSQIRGKLFITPYKI